jgi:hypothetical protein
MISPRVVIYDLLGRRLMCTSTSPAALLGFVARFVSMREKKQTNGFGRQGRNKSSFCGERTRWARENGTARYIYGHVAVFILHFSFLIFLLLDLGG